MKEITKKHIIIECEELQDLLKLEGNIKKIDVDQMSKKMMEEIIEKQGLR